MGADEQTIQILTDQLLAATEEPGPARQQKAQNPATRCEPQARRPLARGVLGFRIRTAPKKKYSVVKDPSTGAPSQGRPKTRTKTKTKIKT
jgi:hypothetical protein